MANKDGRPLVENPRNQVLGVRVTKEEYEQVKAYSSEHQQSISQTVLEGLKLLYQLEGRRDK